MGFTQQQTPTTGVNTEERRFGEFRTTQSSNNQKGGYIKVKKQKFFSRNIVIALALIALLAGGVLEFDMPSKPNKARGQKPADKPYSMTGR